MSLFEQNATMAAGCEPNYYRDEFGRVAQLSTGNRDEALADIVEAHKADIGFTQEYQVVASVMGGGRLVLIASASARLNTLKADIAKLQAWLRVNVNNREVEAEYQQIGQRKEEKRIFAEKAAAEEYNGCCDSARASFATMDSET